MITFLGPVLSRLVETGKGYQECVDNFSPGKWACLLSKKPFCPPVSTGVADLEANWPHIFGPPFFPGVPRADPRAVRAENSARQVPAIGRGFEGEPFEKRDPLFGSPVGRGFEGEPVDRKGLSSGRHRLPADNHFDQRVRKHNPSGKTIPFSEGLVFGRYSLSADNHFGRRLRKDNPSKKGIPFFEGFVRTIVFR